MDLTVAAYTTAGCTGNSTVMTFICDGTCNPAGETTSFTCNYSNYPAASTNYTHFSDLNCADVDVNSTIYNSTQICWNLGGSDSGFPNDYNATSMVVTMGYYQTPNCFYFADSP